MFLYTVPTQTTHIHTEVTTINDSMRQTPRKDKKKRTVIRNHTSKHLKQTWKALEPKIPS